ncbi:MAG: hypothetical protein ACF8Q5_02615 [Phycisphaerales bacterium JB040]
MPGIRRSNLITVSVVLLALGGLGWAASRFMHDPTPGNPIEQQRAAARDRKAANIDSWLAVETVSLAGLDQATVASVLETEFAPWLGELPPERFRALMQTLAGHLLARSAPDLDAYVSFGESDPTTRWTTPADSKRHDAIIHWYAYHTGRDKSELANADLFEMLEAFIALQRDEHGVGLAALGVGPGACWAVPMRVRGTEEMMFRISEAATQEQSSYWFENASQVGLPFQMPVRTAEAAVSDHGPVQAVAICHIVETESGTRWNLHSRWFWDVSLEAWVNDVYSRKSHERQGYIWF